MQDSTTIITDEEKEKRRKKQYKRLGKILSHVWELDDKTNYFQEYTSSELLVRDYDNDNDTVVLCLTDIGQKIDSLKYKVGRHGWIDFAKDLGGVYNLHINSTR